VGTVQLVAQKVGESILLQLLHRSQPNFAQADRSRDVAMATSFMVKIDKIILLTYIRRRGFPKWSGTS